MSSRCVRTWASVLHRSGITVSSRWQFKPCSASQWHRSFFTLAMQASLRLRSGIAVASKSLHAVNEVVASASQLHRSVFTLAMKASLWLRSGIAASSRWQCRSRFGIAVASQCLHAGIAASSRCQFRPRYGFAVVLQRVHAGDADLASAL